MLHPSRDLPQPLQTEARAAMILPQWGLKEIPGKIPLHKFDESNIRPLIGGWWQFSCGCWLPDRMIDLPHTSTTCCWQGDLPQYPNQTCAKGYEPKLLALGAAHMGVSPILLCPQALTSCHLCTTGSRRRGQRRLRTAGCPSAPPAPRCSWHPRCTEGLRGEGKPGVSTQRPLGPLALPLAPQDLLSLPACG